MGNVTRPARASRLVLANPADLEEAARAIAQGTAVASAFANFYVILARGDEASVRRINRMKGRPADQVGSVTTTRDQVSGLFDWSRLPPGLDRDTVLALIDALFEVGPFGFRGPAAAHVPTHLTHPDAGVRTAQVIAPGYSCPSNALVTRALDLLSQDHLYITSCNRSRHATGADDEPAHYRADGIVAEFGGEEDFLVLRHGDEAAARRAYPWHAPMSTTILAFHRVAGFDDVGRPWLVVERHGSLHLDDVRAVAARLGFGIAVGAHASSRLAQRRYISPCLLEVV